MKKHYWVSACLVLALGISQPVYSADLFTTGYEGPSMKDGSYEMPPLWNGWYVGVFAGGGAGSADIDDEYTYNTYDPLAQNTINLSVLNAAAQIGYNVQRGNLVLGLEAGLGFLNFDDGVTDDDLRPEGSNWNDAWGERDKHTPISATYDLSGNLYGELTGRIGYAKDRELWYLKGGAAFVNADFDAHYSGNNVCTGDNDWWCNTASDHSIFDFGKSDTLVGWTLGIGLEYALSNSLSLKAEYQHFDFGSISYHYDDTFYFNPAKTLNAHSTLSGDIDTDLTLDVVKLGVNYKLQDTTDELN